MTTLQLPIGISDFKEVVEEGCYFIDKTKFIEEVVTDKSKVMLFTRPRRFGKTLNLSMLYYFLTNNKEEINPRLYNGTAISKLQKICEVYQNQHPVIFVTFKGIKESNFKEAKLAIQSVISRLYRNLLPQLEPFLAEDDLRIFTQIKEKESDDSDLKYSLAYLCQFFQKATGKKAYILLDEYDTPITASYVNDYYDEMIIFMRGLMGESLKDNKYLAKGVVTGITRISQESIFSGVNNLEIFSMLRGQGGQYFGFTEAEVKQLLAKDQHNDQFDEIKSWYNGYQVGKHILYNPWSIINCIKQSYRYEPYWLNTSDNALIRQLIKTGKRSIKAKMIDLLQGKTIERPLRENLVFPRLTVNEEAFWSLMHASGYLNASDGTTIDYDANAKLSIPNREINYVYSDIVEHWFTDTIDLDTYKKFTSSLESGKINEFHKILSAYLLESVSYFDLNKNTPEQVFHTFMLGLVVGLRDDYVITSNQESGFGRYDLMLIPKDSAKHGLLLEFKTSESYDQLKGRAEEALSQIKDKKYTAAFSQHEIKSALLLGLAFHGKQVEIASATAAIPSLNPPGTAADR